MTTLKTTRDEKHSGLHSLDQVDALARLRDRLFGLRCAISGAVFASDADRSGLLQWVDDLAEDMRVLCSTAAPESGPRP